MDNHKYKDMFDRTNDFLYFLDIQNYSEIDTDIIRMNEYIHSYLNKTLVYLTKIMIKKGIE